MNKHPYKHQILYYLFDEEEMEWVQVYFHNTLHRYTYCTSNFMEDNGGYTTLRQALKAREKYEELTNRYPNIYQATQDLIL